VTRSTISVRTSLPPAFTARERAAVNGYFGRHAPPHRLTLFFLPLFAVLWAVTVFTAIVA